MQTFLPYSNFSNSAKVLDNKRLGKQRVECKQILNACFFGGGWKNHPAVKMWRGYEDGLYQYYNTVVSEWRSRGFRHDMILSESLLEAITSRYSAMPPWFGLPEFHLSHQSNLLRKDPVYYGKYFVDVPDNLPYFWPSGILFGATSRVAFNGAWVYV